MVGVVSDFGAEGASLFGCFECWTGGQTVITGNRLNLVHSERLNHLEVTQGAKHIILDLPGYLKYILHYPEVPHS